MFAPYFMQLLFAVMGLLSLSAAVFDWDWFFTTRTVQQWTCHCSRKRARAFYGFLGFLMIAMAVFAFLKS